MSSLLLLSNNNNNNNTISITTTNHSISTTSRETSIGIEVKLSSLQDRCKRDPEGYKSDYDAQVRRLQSEVDILFLSPSSYNPTPARLVELIQFVAAVSSSCYKETESNTIANLLMNLLTGGSHNHNNTTNWDNKNNLMKQQLSTSSFLSTLSSSTSYLAQLHKDIRRACVSALILMRNKGAIPPLILLQLFFQLISTAPDKHIREICYNHIVNDIKNLNKKCYNETMNRSVQSFLHRIILAAAAASSSSDSTSSITSPSVELAARKSVQMASDLYRRGIWTEERTVAILASGASTSITSVFVPAMKFFLNIEDIMAEDEKQKEEEQFVSQQRVNLHLYSSKTKKRQRHVERQKKNRAKAQEKHEKRMMGQDVTNGLMDSIQKSKKLYPAIELLRDPQGLAESILKRLRSGGGNQYKFQVKLLMVNFLTRLVGNHELLLLPLYPYLQRYMGGHQRDVTAILAYTVQACHSLVPPDEVYGVLKTIAHNFITERCSGEQMAVGINAVRAICSRCPSVMNTEDEGSRSSSSKRRSTNNDVKDDDNPMSTNRVAFDMEGFAQDLAGYAKHRDRSAAVAGRAWINFVREVHPALLAGKDRGKAGSALARLGEKPLRYGEQKAAFGVEGADLLVEYEAKKAARIQKETNMGGNDEESWETTDDENDEENIDEDKSISNDEDIEEGLNDDNSDWEDVESEAEEENTNSDAHDEESNDWVAVQHEDDESDDDTAPELVNLDEEEDNAESEPSVEPAINLSKLSDAERNALRQNVSSTRIFSAADFEKMRKLVARAERDKRDPRAAARRKRMEALGKSLVELSDDERSVESNDEDDDAVKTAGVVRPDDIMAEAKRKRQSKAEKLEKIMAGREKFQHKARAGGSTNEEKKRKKNFLMQKFSHEMRGRKNLKASAVLANKRKSVNRGTHEAKKRRRKL